MADKVRIAHLAGPTATIQNTPPLVTSNKARRRHGLSLLTGVDGAPLPYDALRGQRLAAPAKVYVEQFSAHPLEADSAALYAPPDGYMGADGTFSEERRSPGDKPVYEIEMLPEDGLYPCPTWRARPTGRPGRRNARPPAPPTRRRARGSILTGRAVSRDRPAHGRRLRHRERHLGARRRRLLPGACRPAVTGSGLARAKGRISARATFRRSAGARTSSPTSPTT